jgi:hypothetical protein
MPLVVNFPNKGWNFGLLSSHPELDLAFVQAHLDKPWNWHGTKSKCFKYCGGYGDGISQHPQLTLQFVKTNLSKDWHLYGSKRNGTIAFLSKPWVKYFSMREALLDYAWRFVCLLRIQRRFKERFLKPGGRFEAIGAGRFLHNSAKKTRSMF